MKAARSDDYITYLSFEKHITRYIPEDQESMKGKIHFMRSLIHDILCLLIIPNLQNFLNGPFHRHYFRIFHYQFWGFQDENVKLTSQQYKCETEKVKFETFCLE